MKKLTEKVKLDDGNLNDSSHIERSIDEKPYK